jgi:hypothetical protein
MKTILCQKNSYIEYHWKLHCLGGRVMVFCFIQKFFPEFNIRLYDKKSESDYFFFLHQNQNIFFSNIGNQNILKQKKLPVLRNIQYGPLLFFNSTVSYTYNHCVVDYQTTGILGY